MNLNRKLRFGMIGGGKGAFIGAVHRIVAAMDGEAELVAGAFSSDPERSRASGADLRLDPGRAYGSYAEMAKAEAAHPPETRLDFVVIVTPNHEHFGPAALFLQENFHVICDKPLCMDLAQARKLAALVDRTDSIFVLTHNYTGYPMVKEAREFVRRGELGEVRKIVVEYPQGWLARALEDTGHKQAAWRSDPKRAGLAGCLGDIGTHAENLARYISGLRIRELCADLTTFVPGRKLDDDANLLLRYEGGAKGVLHASQISIGEENNLNIRIYGTQASLAWRQEHPNQLVVKRLGAAEEIRSRGQPYLSAPARGAARIPPGHPEGYLEAFANVYREAFRAIRADLAGDPQPADLDFPTIADGVEGMLFLDTAVKSSRLGAKWLKMRRSTRRG
jgi:predicted dehydrogenase